MLKKAQSDITGSLAGPVKEQIKTAMKAISTQRKQLAGVVSSIDKKTVLPALKAADKLIQNNDAKVVGLLCM